MTIQIHMHGGSPDAARRCRGPTFCAKLGRHRNPKSSANRMAHRKGSTLARRLGLASLVLNSPKRG